MLQSFSEQNIDNVRYSYDGGANIREHGTHTADSGLSVSTDKQQISRSLGKTRKYDER